MKGNHHVDYSTRIQMKSFLVLVLTHNACDSKKSLTLWSFLTCTVGGSTTVFNARSCSAAVLVLLNFTNLKKQKTSLYTITWICHSNFKRQYILLHFLLCEMPKTNAYFLVIDYWLKFHLKILGGWIMILIK